MSDKWSVTLSQLRKAGACVSGYNRLVCALKGVEYKERETYIRFSHKEIIPIAFIVESNGIEDALWSTKCLSGCDRDLRLFSVWCARQVQNLMEDQRSIYALDVAERFANGNATEIELAAARDAARAAAWDAAWDAARAAAWDAARDAARAAAWDAAWDAARAAAWDAQKVRFVQMLEKGEF